MTFLATDINSIAAFQVDTLPADGTAPKRIIAAQAVPIAFLSVLVSNDDTVAHNVEFLVASGGLSIAVLSGVVPAAAAVTLIQGELLLNFLFNLANLGTMIWAVGTEFSGRVGEVVGAGHAVHWRVDVGAF